MKKIMLLIGWMSGLQGVSALESDQSFSNEKSLNKSVLSKESLIRGPSSEGAREEKGEALRSIRKECLEMDLPSLGELLKKAVDNLQEVKCFFSNPSLMPELPDLLSDVCARMEAPMKLEQDLLSDLMSVFSQLQSQISKAEEILVKEEKSLQKKIIAQLKKSFFSKVRPFEEVQYGSIKKVQEDSSEPIDEQALNERMLNLSQAKTMLRKSQDNLRERLSILMQGKMEPFYEECYETKIEDKIEDEVMDSYL